MNLIFLPGASGNTAFWQPIIQRLPQDDSTMVVAYPSFGGYPDEMNVQSFESLQDDVLNQIQQPSVVIAQSMGGIFAVQAALQKAEQVQALVLVATSGGIDLSPFQVVDWRVDYQQSFTVPDWFIQHQSDLTDSLERIQCPVLLIWGDADPISPVAVGQALHRQIPHAELHIVSQGQHDLAYVHAEHVAQLIQNFLTKLRV
ncbi:alpha/beta hydrolase [Acinetobacter johnsonii]|uniref:alpha/beta fold hydrolase n=1 Tax=Acinetobacter johnsonii TaxID=40214 RepID=UPI00196B7DB2|nr:alpha/beta hydrolase [Acinetobacter johnsonii]MDH1408580.1 alpha/beta hydrolase [Acinetobacter johnsonii]QSE45730.1 alpha/beta fold hydrolase [Acinetobacter johnsonii]